MGARSQFGERIMVSGPTSRAVSRSKEEEEEEEGEGEGEGEEEEEDDEIAVLPISIPDSGRAVLAALGYFMDKRPLQKHSKLSKRLKKFGGI